MTTRAIAGHPHHCHHAPPSSSSNCCSSSNYLSPFMPTSTPHPRQYQAIPSECLVTLKGASTMWSLCYPSKCLMIWRSQMPDANRLVQNKASPWQQQSGGLASVATASHQSSTRSKTPTVICHVVGIRTIVVKEPAVAALMRSFTRYPLRGRWIHRSRCYGAYHMPIGIRTPLSVCT